MLSPIKSSSGVGMMFFAILGDLVVLAALLGTRLLGTRLGRSNSVSSSTTLDEQTEKSVCEERTE